MSEENEIKSPSMTKAKVRGMYFAMFMTFMTAIGIPTLNKMYPEVFESAEEKQLNKKEALEVVKNYPVYIKNRDKKDSIRVNKKIAKLAVDLHALREENIKLKQDITALQSLTEANQRQNNFNSHAIGQTNDVLKNVLIKKYSNSCGFTWYEDKNGNSFYPYKDIHNTELLYPIDQLRNCKGYIKLIDREIIKIE